MSAKRVLIVGTAGLAFKRFYQPVLKGLLSGSKVNVYGVDIAPWGGAEELNGFWTVDKGWDPAGSHPGLKEAATFDWDMVLIVTPPETHALIAEFFLDLAVDTPNGMRPIVVVEKPLSDDRRTAGELLARWSNMQPRPNLRVLDHYAYGKPAVRSLVDSDVVDGFEARTIWFASFESERMKDSRSFEQGYLLEHAASHGPAMVNRLLDVREVRLPQQGRFYPQGGRYEGDPPTLRDTWSLVSFDLELAGSQRAVPFHVGVGKGIGHADQKWLRIDGLDSEGLVTRILADISSGRVVIHRDAGPEVLSEARTDDSYAHVLGELLSLNPPRVERATCPPERAAHWLEVFQEASEKIASELSAHHLGEVPDAVRSFLDEIQPI